MPISPETAQLRPPDSVVKIVGFLADVRMRQSLGKNLDLNQAWTEHDISINHVDGFLHWLNADRNAKPFREMELSTAPNKSLAKKREEQKVDDENKERPRGDNAEEPAINIHLWNALFRSGPRKGRRNIPQAPSFANKATGMARGYNGNFMLATLALSGQDLGGNPPFSPEHRQSIPVDEGTLEAEALRSAPILTNGLGSAAFGQRVANRAEGIAPLWNDPMRRDLLPTFNAPDLQLRDTPNQAALPTEVADPLFGQVTLVAPPLTVSPEGGQSAVAGLRFDWKDMAKNAGLVDGGGMATLAKTLPAGSQVLYPAIDPRKLRGGAVNLKLEPRFAVELAEAGYGNQARVDGRKSARLAADWYGGTPPSRLLPANMVPIKHSATGAGSAQSKVSDPNRRMRFLDFLGLPIYLSPQLNVTPDLEQESRARIHAEFLPRSPIISPGAFDNIRSRMLGGFYGVEARADRSLRSAAPDLSGAGAIASLLASRMRVPELGPGISRAARPAVSTMGSFPGAPGLGAAMGRSALPMLAGGSLAMLSPRVPSRVPPTMPGVPAAGAMPQPEVPRFIRHDPGTVPGKAPTAFRPTIPTIPQAATAPRGQGATAPQPASPMTRISPQINVSAERQPPPARSLPARQSMPSTPPAKQPTPMEGPKPARAAMMPMATGPRPTSPQTAERMKPQPAKVAQPMSPDEPRAGAGLKPPSMLVAPAKSVPALKADHEPLAVQTSSSAPSGAASESAATRSAEVAEKKEAGLPGSEINLLANEVWILLKRRLAFEAQRMGR